LPGLPSSVFVCVVFVRVIVRVFVRMIVHARVLVSLNRFLIALPRMQLYKVNRFASAGRGCMNRCARTRRRATEPRYREDDRVMRLQPTATCALAPDHPSVRGKSQPCRPLPSGRTPARPGGRRPSSRLRRRGAVVARGSHVPRRGRERGRGAWACLLLPPLPSLHLRASLPCSRIISCSTSRHPAAAVRFTGNAPSPWEAYVACVLRPLSRPRGDSVHLPLPPRALPPPLPPLLHCHRLHPSFNPCPLRIRPRVLRHGTRPLRLGKPGPPPQPRAPPCSVVGDGAQRQQAPGVSARGWRPSVAQARAAAAPSGGERQGQRGAQATAGHASCCVAGQEPASAKAASAG